MVYDEAFCDWFALVHLSIASLVRYGDCPAVYALRDARTKDILKFGNTDRLRRRIFANYLGGVGGNKESTTQRIHRELFLQHMVDHVELSYLEAKNKAEAEHKENEFRQAYKQSNGRRPKWDLMG